MKQPGILLLAMMLPALLLTGCIVRQVQVVCNPPYMPLGTECCFDKNNNSICDYDEDEEDKTTEQETGEQQTAQEDTAEEQPPAAGLPAYKPLTTALRSVVVIDVMKDGEISGYGSGFFIDDEGYVLTNTHVVDEYDPTEVSYVIETYSGKEYNASLIDWSWDYDIALLKIKERPDYGIQHLEFGSVEDSRIGDEIYVLGSPMGLDFSIAKGILSAKDREGMRNEKIMDYIQIDAALNPGNSGGPVLSKEGNVIGIATFGYLFLEGLNFALESDTAKKLYMVMKTERAAIPDASIPECWINTQLYKPVRSSYGFKNAGKEIEGKKPSDLAIFYKESEGKIYFNSITATFLNKGDATRKLCFHMKIINNAQVIFNQDIAEELTIESKTMVTNYPVEIGFTTGYDADWYYYELNAYDCDTRQGLYKFYRKDRYDIEHRKGDMEIFEDCKSYFTLTSSANI